MSIATMFLCLGCSTDESPKTSLFEHDHHVAEHWPSDLADLADKLRNRIERLKNGTRAPEDLHDHHDEHDHEPVPLRVQIEDLVGWVGEVAADTNLSEAEWIPLYESSEAVSANLKSTGDSLTVDDLNQIEKLCELLDATIPKTPVQISD